MTRAEAARIEADRRELERLRQWLRYLLVYTRGKAASLAGLALNTPNHWPPRAVRTGPPRKKP